MDADPHVHFLLQLPADVPATRHVHVTPERHGNGATEDVCLASLPDGADHAESHVHAAAGVSSLGFGDAGDTVVTVPQDLNTETLVLLDRKETFKEPRHTKS